MLLIEVAVSREDAVHLSARMTPALAGLIAILLAACAGREAVQGEATLPDGARVTHRAVLIGTNHHRTVGTITLYDTGTTPIVVFEPNFRTAGTRNVWIRLGRNGEVTGPPVVPLARTAGRQAYVLPEEAHRFNEIWLWQVTDDSPIGRALLTPL